MSTKIFTDAFFNQFHEFLGQLITVFPADADFPAYKTGLTLLRRVNPSMVISEFKAHVFPYDEIIRARNTDFFMNHTFEDVVSSDMSMDSIIRKLKDLWATLSVKSRDAIWTHIILLLDIAKRC